ncbi:hypothetical protein [Catenulispora subtropica]|uniref:Uncharacterized protein n=1 Tax=Catenulispora subtropica TaxID=450798 RepID=A0ABN2QRH7_9ACTN
MGSQESRPAADAVARMQDAVATLARDPSTVARAQQVVADIEGRIAAGTLEFNPEVPIKLDELRAKIAQAREQLRLLAERVEARRRQTLATQEAARAELERVTREQEARRRQAQSETPVKVPIYLRALISPDSPYLGVEDFDDAYVYDTVIAAGNAELQAAGLLVRAYKESHTGYQGLFEWLQARLKGYTSLAQFNHFVDILKSPREDELLLRLRSLLDAVDRANRFKYSLFEQDAQVPGAVDSREGVVKETLERTTFELAAFLSDHASQFAHVTIDGMSLYEHLMQALQSGSCNNQYAEVVRRALQKQYRQVPPVFSIMYRLHVSGYFAASGDED